MIRSSVLAVVVMMSVGISTARAQPAPAPAPVPAPASKGRVAFDMSLGGATVADYEDLGIGAAVGLGLGGWVSDRAAASFRFWLSSYTADVELDLGAPFELQLRLKYALLGGALQYQSGRAWISGTAGVALAIVNGDVEGTGIGAQLRGGFNLRHTPDHAIYAALEVTPIYIEQETVTVLGLQLGWQTR